MQEVGQTGAQAPQEMQLELIAYAIIIINPF